MYKLFVKALAEMLGILIITTFVGLLAYATTFFVTGTLRLLGYTL